MNLLSINKFYYIKGGSETYLFALEEELKREGHSIYQFSMKDNKNKDSITSQYFVENIDYNNAGIIDKLKLAPKIIFSYEAYKNICELLKMHKVDLAHLHIFQHQLSPSILFPLKKKKIPVVYTVHDLKPLCPNYKMLTNDKVCELCKGNKFYNVVLNKCTKDSLVASTLSMFEAYIHKFLGIYENYIDHFITPSNFYREKMIDWGIPAHKVTHIPNFVNPSSFKVNYNPGNYFLYLGRLSNEKGIKTLIKSVKQSSDNISLKIVGDGLLKDDIKQYIKDNSLEDRIELLGFKQGDELEELIRGCKAVVMPSEWYENGPLSLIESFAYGKPVIGSNIGGIPEHIDHMENGILFEAGNFKDLAEKITLINNLDETDLIDLGKNARKKVEEVYNSSFHMKKLMQVYNLVQDNKVYEYKGE
ncbi:glycosyltransferase family 4 protein [Niallia circulans]|uniref:Glycosyltransferase family 4 protein n=1 Tax=Niallia circulans TaxID=1397 RepID=A0A941GL42_NIACI|nr:glycosyltransferase family 4 protein [Niallia circulans]MCB5237685.1 glycosyltransferase family 4 protein [Niallia circulans]